MHQIFGGMRFSSQCNIRMKLAFCYFIIFSIPALLLVGSVFISPFEIKGAGVCLAGFLLIVHALVNMQLPRYHPSWFHITDLWLTLTILAAECVLLVASSCFVGSIFSFVALLVVSYIPLSGKQPQQSYFKAISLGNICIGISLSIWGMSIIFISDLTIYTQWLVVIGALLYTLIILNQYYKSWNM